MATLNNECTKHQSAEAIWLQKAQQGDEAAAAILIKQYQGLLCKAAAQPHLKGLNDDAYGEACICFYKAVMEYDASRGTPFSGYARSKVYAGVHNVFRRQLRIWQNETALCPGGDDDDSGNSGAENIAEPADMEYSVVVKLTLDTILQSLPLPQQQVAIEIFINGSSLSETARTLNISVQAARMNYIRAVDFIKDRYKHHHIIN